MTAQTIAKAARTADVHVETIRYYERMGLIQRPRTTGTAYRLYPSETVRRIRFIKRAQRLGFTLREISELLRLRAGKESTSATVRRHVEKKLDDVEQRITDLVAMRQTLRDLMSTCSGRGGTDRCPILRSLDEDVPSALEETPSAIAIRKKQ